MDIFLRRITTKDCKLLFNWVNDPKVRENSINSEPIKWSEHVEWFESKTNDPDSQIFILESQGISMGQIRFEKEEDYYKIDYLIDRKFRGQGLGKKILAMGIKEITGEIRAWVKNENVASFKILEDLGFRQEKTNKEGFIQYSLYRREHIGNK